MWIEPDGFFGAFPYLALLGVKKAFRGMGIGHTLVETFIGVSRSLGYRKCSLLVSHSGEPLQPQSQEPLPVPGLQKGGLCARLHPPRHP